MSDLPEMKPGAAERLPLHTDTFRERFGPLLEIAFHDGVAAGDKRAVERIAALLRAEADAQFDLSPGYVIEHAQAICTTLRSIADRIETEGKDG